jgi:hypothetical protein
VNDAFDPEFPELLLPDPRPYECSKTTSWRRVYRLSENFEDIERPTDWQPQQAFRRIEADPVSEGRSLTDASRTNESFSKDFNKAIFSERIGGYRERKC